jgi:hypothetical protein
MTGMTADIVTDFHEVIKVTKELSEHALYVWNFYWIVTAAVLGYVLTDKGDVLASPKVRQFLIGGYICFVAGNGAVLHRAADKHDMGHQWLLKIYRERKAGGAGIPKEGSAGVSDAGLNAEPQVPELKKGDAASLDGIVRMLVKTRPTPAWGIRVMHSILSLGICALIWFAPVWKRKTGGAGESSGPPAAA